MSLQLILVNMKKLLYLLLFIPFGVFGQTQTVNVGVTANDHTGDPLRTAFQKVNTNFSAVRDSFGNIYREVQSRKLVNDSLNAVRAAALDLGTVAWLKTDTAYIHKQIITFDQLQNYAGGGTIGMYELKGTIGTTTGIPENGDSLIINTGFIAHPHPLVYKNGLLQNYLTGYSHNIVSVAKVGSYVFAQSTGTIIVRPVFSTGDVLVVHTFDPIVWNSLTPEGGSGGGGGGGGSPLLDSLIAVWEFNEIAGTGFADVVGGSNGTGYVTTPNQAGKLGVAVKIGYKGSIVVPYASRLATQSDRISLSAWFKLDTIPSVAGYDESFITLWDNTYHIVARLWAESGDNKVWGEIHNTAAGEHYVNSGAVTVSPGTWYHAVLVSEGAGRTIKLYLNGVQTAGTSFVGTLHAFDGNITIGNQQNTYEQSVRGVMDQTGYWYQRLMPADIVLLYNSGAGRAHPFN